MLIAPLQVHIGRRPEIGPGFQHSRMTDTGIKPHIQNVRLLFEGVILTMSTDRSGGHQALGLPFKPDIGAMLPDQCDNVIHHGLRHQFLAAMAAIKYGNRNPPEALSGNTPVGPVFHHAVDPVPAPGRNPVDRIDGLKGFFPQVIFFHGDKPLLGGTENDRLLAAPAVGIGMLDIHEA